MTGAVLFAYAQGRQKEDYRRAEERRAVSGLSKWMWKKPGKDAGAELVLFRKEIYLEACDREVFVRISADTRYKFYVNGRLVSLGPSKGDKQVWFYDRIDLSACLVRGKNALAVEVFHYPAVHNAGNHSLFRTDTPGLYIEEEYAGLKEPAAQSLEDMENYPDELKLAGGIGIFSDHSWKYLELTGDRDVYRMVRENEVFAPLHFMEERTGDAVLAGWKQPGYEDGSASPWQPAYVYPASDIRLDRVPGNLSIRTIPFMNLMPKRFEKTLAVSSPGASLSDWDALLAGEKPHLVSPHSKEIVELHAGEEETGFLSFRFAGGKQAAVRILCAESYGYENRQAQDSYIDLPLKGDRLDFKNGKLNGFWDSYTVGGFGTKEQPEAYEPYWFRTFRFVRLEIETKEEALELLGLDYQETGYPLKAETKVHTNDSSMEKVWDISLRTLKRCMQETYTDCPFYEQLQYIMDSRSQILYTYAVSADDRLARKCIDDFARSQRYDGLLNASYPNYESNVIPGFSIYYILMLHDHMMYFGDKDFLWRYVPTTIRILQYFQSHLEGRGLVGKIGGINGRDRYWSFVDWTKEWDATSGVPDASGQGPITMESLLYLLGLEKASEIMGWLGMKDLAAQYGAHAEELKIAVNEHCRDADGFYLDGPDVAKYSQHCQVFAVLTHTADCKQGRRLLLQTLEKKERFAQCSVAMALYLFQALRETGLYDSTDGLWDLWRNMVKKNLTTCAEDDIRERSDCHAWGALALYELPCVVLGVRPAEPGYGSVEIQPEPGRFTWAEGSVITPKGSVQVSWKKQESGELVLSCQLPQGMKLKEQK